MKIAGIEAFALHPKVVKEAWIDDEYVWPSVLPSFLVKVTAGSVDLIYLDPRFNSKAT